MSTEGQPKVSDFGISAFMDNTIAQVSGAGAASGSASMHVGRQAGGEPGGCPPVSRSGPAACGRAPRPPRPAHAPPPQCHTFLGTVTYMSPERLNGEPYSFPADVWALGLTLLECATGKYPYDASGGTIQLMIQVGRVGGREGVGRRARGRVGGDC